MDDESKQLLREIRDIQKEQLELLRPCFRPGFRFGLRTLMIAFTVTAIVLGIAAILAKIGDDNMGTTAPPIPATKE